MNAEEHTPSPFEVRNVSNGRPPNKRGPCTPFIEEAYAREEMPGTNTDIASDRYQSNRSTTTRTQKRRQRFAKSNRERRRRIAYTTERLRELGWTDVQFAEVKQEVHVLLQQYIADRDSTREQPNRSATNNN